MKLLPVSNILKELGFDDMPDARNGISSALDVATQTLMALLNTDFEFATVVDTFHVREPGAVFVSGCQTEFRLAHGFVTQVISARVSSTFSGNYTTDAYPAMVLKNQKGILIDYETNYRNDYLKVSYVKGFETKQVDGETVFDPAKVPKWLQMAAGLQARILMGSNPSFKSGGLDQDLGVLGRQLNDLLYPNLRYAPIAVTPL